MPDTVRQSASNGHGADQHRGRFVLADADLQRNTSHLVAATGQLLGLAGVHARSVLTRVGGLRLHHFEAGAGRPVLLIHGASGGGANWYRVIPRLSAGRQVLAIDLPGFGFSEAIDPVAPLGLQVAQLLVQWLDAHGLERVCVAGTSFGGLVALQLARIAPERVELLAVIDSVGLGSTLPLSLRVACLPVVSSIALRPSRAGLRRQFETLMTADPAAIPSADREALLEYLWQSASAADHSRVARAFRLFTGLTGQREVLSDDELRALALPLLILWGERDQFLPVAHAQRAAALVPRARCRIIPRAGHSPNWEAPAVVAEYLDDFFPA